MILQKTRDVFWEKPHERMIFPDFSKHKVRNPGSRSDHPQEQLESIEMNSTLVETWPRNTRGEGGQISHPDFRYKVEISTDPVVNGDYKIKSINGRI